MRAPSAGRLGPTVAGTWYPASHRELERQIASLLDGARGAGPAPDPARRVLALIAPHAGFEYSGQVAAVGFQHLAGRRLCRVIVVGPSHYQAFGGAALPSASRYVTPLGEIPIDTDAVLRLAEEPGVVVDDHPFLPEHCLEAELPFLQSTLTEGWRLLPALIGAGSSPSEIEQVSDALRALGDADTLVVVSSDLTHFGPRFSFVPFDREIPERIRELDMGAVERILARDRPGFESYVRRTGATVCGRRAIEVLLRLLPSEVDAVLAAYDTSGRMTDTWDHSVSYASLLFRDPA